MKLYYNIKKHDEKVTFCQALIRGLGRNKGLFFPEYLPKFSLSKIENLLEMDLVERSVHILSEYIGSELSKNCILDCVKKAFNFSVPLISLSNNIAILELFHGPTLAFKDFGSQLMAQMLNIIQRQYDDKPIIILTATSGDTGAAVAHAFHGLKDIYVVILYPKGKVSVLQERLFCTLGDNIYAVSVDGDFDACQLLIKKAFNDDKLKKNFYLNSANSINISRLLAQICYYFEGVAQLSYSIRNKFELVMSVPSGNFGNLTAGLLAQSCGLPVKRFIAATNMNNTVPRFLKYGIWKPLPTQTTFANAMDVSNPSNWIRIKELFNRENRSFKELGYGYVNDEVIKKTVQEIADLGYLSEPHTAVAYRLLCDQLRSDEFGICLGTAHPVKFKELVEDLLKKNIQILLPNVLKERMQLPVVSNHISQNYHDLYTVILNLILK